jgi:hypothetical protein
MFYIVTLSGYFHLVEFIVGRSTFVISSEWMLGNDKCCWPSKWKHKPSKVQEAVKSHCKPGKNWQIYDVRILYTGGSFLLN